MADYSIDDVAPYEEPYPQLKTDKIKVGIPLHMLDQP